MLSKERVKEAEQNVKSYLVQGLMKKEPFKQIVYDVLRKNADESLKLAKTIHDNLYSDLWAIVISYYSMYYISNAVLYKLGYKVGEKISHKITSDALMVYVRKHLHESLIEDYEDSKEQALAGIKADELIESFDFERRKRSRIQYKTEEIEKHAKAKTSLQRAIVFATEMEKLIEKTGKNAK
ncbi:MAG TPA: hypothetical protein VJG90_08310 [Candidatus Nanoarchaeia archaeon]|nr:hypothetical protein [Candidatus Nanoarchaeia archaeon]